MSGSDRNHCRNSGAGGSTLAKSCLSTRFLRAASGRMRNGRGGCGECCGAGGVGLLSCAVIAWPPIVRDGRPLFHGGAAAAVRNGGSRVAWSDCARWPSATTSRHRRCGAVRETMRTGPTLLMLAVLPGCMAPTLWPVRGETLQLSERHEQRFAVTAVGAQVVAAPDDDAPRTSALSVECKRLAGTCVALLDSVVRDTSWFRLEFADPRSATAATELLTRTSLGRVDRSAIHLEWARDERGYEFWQGRIEIRGELARSWRNARIDAAAAAGLATAASSVRPL